MKNNTTAEEKYYKKHNLRLAQDVNRYRELIEQCRVELHKLKEKNNKLTQENNQYKEWIDRLLQYTELNQADIKVACEKDKTIGSLLGMFKIFGSHLY